MNLFFITSFQACFGVAGMTSLLGLGDEYFFFLVSVSAYRLIKICRIFLTCSVQTLTNHTKDYSTTMYTFHKYIFIISFCHTSFLLLSSRERPLLAAAEPGRRLPGRGAPFVASRDNLSLGRHRSEIISALLS